MIKYKPYFYFIKLKKMKKPESEDPIGWASEFETCIKISVSPLGDMVTFFIKGDNKERQVDILFVGNFCIARCYQLDTEVPEKTYRPFGQQVYVQQISSLLMLKAFLKKIRASMFSSVEKGYHLLDHIKREIEQSISSQR